jgi:hypothetical protein
MVVPGRVATPALLNTPGGPRMSSELKLGRGSKRAVRRIRWNGFEITSFIALMIILSIIAVLAGLWVGDHHID